MRVRECEWRSVCVTVCERERQIERVIDGDTKRNRVRHRTRRLDISPYRILSLPSQLLSQH